VSLPPGNTFYSILKPLSGFAIGKGKIGILKVGVDPLS
jgi:hypothetical protein